MACFQILSGPEVEEAIEWATRRNVPLTITVRQRNCWLTYRSWLVDHSDGFVWLNCPTLHGRPAGQDFAIDDKINVTFRIAQRRFVFSGTVLGRKPHALKDGTESVALKVTYPESMQRVERRRETRVHVPGNWGVRATFWLGGRDLPAAALAEKPMWSGKVINLSRGGASIRANLQATKYIETGDLMGLCFRFGEDDDRDEITVDARFRHAEPDGEMALLGFEFIDLEDSKEARVSLEILREIVEELNFADRQSERPQPQGVQG